jgi:hypothetical protein
MEVDDEMEAARQMQAIIGGIIMSARMFIDGHITMREYMHITEYLEEAESECDISLM